MKPPLTQQAWETKQRLNTSPQLLSDYASQMALVYLTATVFGFIVSFLVAKLYRRLRQTHYEIPARDVSKGHRWCITDIFPQPTYCNVSGNYITHGVFCDSCGICVEEPLAMEANRTLLCKSLSTHTENRRHHWIKGNLPLCSTCDVCHTDCGNRPGLGDLRCCWCNRTIHDKCVDNLSAVCDLGTYRNSIIPPSCVKLKLVGFKGRRHYVVDCVRRPNIPNWNPLIVLANRKSGNGNSEIVLQAFRRLLNPVQVIDLSDIPPECALEWCHLLPEVACRVLVAGGDGTIGWVLHAIDNLKLKPGPEVCILPLGTGNDLSRVLGWGEGYSNDVDVCDILRLMSSAQVVKLDRWQVEITPEKHFGFRMGTKSLIMNNYASIGVDALVTLNFHRHRESSPALFGSRLLNKFWYFTYGTKDVLERECKHIERKVKLELDGVVIDLPKIEGIVVLNIASWGAGCQPWQIGNSSQNIPKASMEDGLVEVFALYSSFHIAQLQVGLAEPLRLGQAKEVKMTLHGGKAPMQVDGEPWEQPPAVITIRHHNHATMLANID